MPKFTVVYFKLSGRAEIMRLLLELGGADWKDTFVEDWGGYKASIIESNAKDGTQFKFPWLPHLEIEGECVVSQSLPAVRLLARRFGFDAESETDRAMVESVLELYNEICESYMPMFFNAEKADDFLKKFEQIGGFLETILSKSTSKSGYFVGEKMTVADLAVYSVVREALGVLKTKAPEKAVDMSKYPHLKAHHEKIAENPKIKAYYSK